MNLLTLRPVNDFNCVGVLAQHCDMNKVCIAENEAIDFDLSDLFCSYWFDILEYWKEVDAYDKSPETVPKPLNYDNKKALIYGGFYESCGNKKGRSNGVKRMLVYYTYSRYVMINQTNDSATGMKYSNSDFATNIPFKDLKQISDKYRTMAYNLYKDVKAFICYSGVLTNWNDCGKCGCGKDCDRETKATGYGFKGRSIRKKI